MSTAWPNGDRSVVTGNGYYEAEVLFPPGVGTWPSFWTNDYSSLQAKAANSSAASIGGREVDFIEQYNMFNGYTTGQIKYIPGQATQNTLFHADTNNLKEQMGWRRHRIGAKLTDTTIVYYLDDVAVFTDPNKYNLSGVADPSQLFVMLTFALGAGWPLAVPPAGRYDAFYNYVRYYA
jgi:beta-glucanase (GH16 family)